MDVVCVQKGSGGIGAMPSKLLDKGSFNGVLASLFAEGFECVEARYLVRQIVALGFDGFRNSKSAEVFGVDWATKYSFNLFLKANLDYDKYEFVKCQGRKRIYEKVKKKSGQSSKQDS
jgi:hypothetical protein